MKRKTCFLIMLSALLLFLASCAAQFPFIASASLSEATELKVLCGQQKLTSGELKVADSLYAQGSVLEKKGKNELAFTLLDQAVVYYRLALTRAAIEKKELQISKEQKALAKTQEDVSAYQQVLQKLKTMEQQ